jgi:cell division septation protein DedD
MRLNKISNYILILLIPLLISCSSKSYDIEEVEEESTEEQNKTTEHEIKKETEPPQEELKTIEPKEEVSKEPEGNVYTIQIGAFNLENNAVTIMNRAKDEFNYEVYYRFIDGYFKVGLGKFKSRAEALSILGKIQASGYADAFITVFFK